VGQSFTGDGRVLNNAVFYIKKSGSPTGNAYAKIYAHSGTFGTSSVPTGAALAVSEGVDVSNLTTSFQLIAFNFSGANKITLTNGTKYVVVIEYTGGTLYSHEVVVGYDTGTPSHPGNFCAYHTGWTAYPTTDLCFYVYYEEETEKFYVNQSGDTYIAGNLGIGTTGPDSKLEINASSGETPFKVKQPASATETLRPNAAGDITQLWNYPEGTQTDNWSYVDEVTADDGDTYVCQEYVVAKDLYNLPAHSGSGTIDKITVRARIKIDCPDPAKLERIVMKTGGLIYYSGNLTTAEEIWEDKSYEWAINPQTELAWTWDDIDALQIGIETNYAWDYSDVICTQLYVEVDYTIPLSTTFVIDSSGNVGIGTTSPSFKLQVDGSIGPNVAPTLTSVSRTTTQISYGTDDVGSYSSLAIGADGLPIIAHKNNTDDDLMVTKCGNAACSSGNTSIWIEASGDTGAYTSIAIGTDGLPVISLFNNSTDDLVVTKCNSADCSSSSTTQISDSDHIGLNTSLA
ncbi:unnamed protein product, partial [marine sediment metagenome]